MPAADLTKAESQCYYLPTHGVLKESSTTTKLRIVYDASASSSTGVSLNGQLLLGPNLYPHLTSLILTFRQHAIGLTGNISKMFREVGLHEGERDYHRYLVRDVSQNLVECRMKRLTFGVTCSPFLATQVLHQVAEDHAPEHPIAAAMVKSYFYVDDVLTGDTMNTSSHTRTLQIIRSTSSH